MNLKINKIKSIFSLSQLLKYNRVITLLTAAVILISVSVFLYYCFYKILAQSEEITVLKEQMISVKVDTELYNQVLANIENKKTPPEINLKELKNPFLPYTSSN
ncbi:hypothetical protein KKD19_04510 [Patescibacteria group bacterium]|nr:hypothetical protein [Patescibacteria group bacterium]MBU4512470.1 hypothetical protein [Patescibacteria group bacterium]MCG2692598.1 hypothetical protein [Candidatus Parcubacteria bacterium]